MDNLEFRSSLLDLAVSTENIYEYVTTVNPFEYQTTELPETVNNGIFIVIYGIGGVLIFFVIFTICYGYCMPNLSDEVINRIFAQDRNRLQRLIAEQNEARNYNSRDIEEVVSPNSVQVPRTELSQVTEQSPEMPNITAPEEQPPFTNLERMPRVEQVRPTPNSPPRQRTFLRDRIRDLLYSNTTPKQVAENSPNTASKSDTTKEEDQNKQLCISPLKETECKLYSKKDSADPLVPNTVAKEKLHSHNQMCQEDNVESTKISVQPPSTKGRSRSSPTSPDNVRRRISSNESTPRRPSSWR